MACSIASTSAADPGVPAVVKEVFHAKKRPIVVLDRCGGCRRGVGRQRVQQLDQHHSLAVEDLVQSQSCDLFGAIETIQIDVIHAAFSIFVDQRESGAAHVLGFHCA